MRLFFFLLLSFWLTASHAEQLIIEPDMGRAPILAAIAKTHSNIDLVMYGFTEPEFMHALMNAKNAGKDVRVLLEKTPYKNETENALATQTLQKDDINLKWSNPAFQLTHQKTFIFDHTSALIMTFNLTHSSFSNERNFALLIDEPALVNEIENVFQADWEHKNISIPPSQLVWSPDNSRKQLMELINKAQASIEIYAQDISDYQTVGALARAARNGVTVKILTSSTKNRGKYAYMRRAGVIIHYSKQYYIHAKVLIIDHQLALLGSMNLTKPSIDDNRELSILTHNTETVHELEKTFEKDWE